MRNSVGPLSVAHSKPQSFPQMSEVTDDSPCSVSSNSSMLCFDPKLAVVMFAVLCMW